MIAPVSEALASRVLQTPAQDEAPIRVGRLKRALVRSCLQPNSVTVLYIGQTATFESAGDLQHFFAGDVLILSGDATLKVERAVNVWVLEFRWEALAPFLSGAGRTSPAWRQFAAALGVPSETLKAYSVSAEDRSTWQRCLETLDQEVRAGRLGYCETAKAYLTLLLVNLARLIETEIVSLPLVIDPLSAKVLAYIEAHFREPLTLEGLAEHVHRSPGYLTTRLREQIGQPVMDYVIGRRMQEAETLLKMTDVPVQTVGERVGYPDPSTFSRQFRKRHGVSPAAWRSRER